MNPTRLWFVGAMGAVLSSAVVGQAQAPVTVNGYSAIQLVNEKSNAGIYSGAGAMLGVEVFLQLKARDDHDELARVRIVMYDDAFKKVSSAETGKVLRAGRENNFKIGHAYRVHANSAEHMAHVSVVRLAGSVEQILQEEWLLFYKGN